MKIAHFTVITPNRCGLYETAREMVEGLRSLGFDSRLVDPDSANNPVNFEGDDDRGTPIASLDWAQTADLYINHSGLGDFETRTVQPIIHVAHGRPLYSFLGEMDGGTPVYSYHYGKAQSDRYKAVVTLWDEHKPYHDVMWHPVPVYSIPSPVDLDKWTPEGAKGYQFGGKKGKKNFVITDAWRKDVNPFIPLNNFALYQRKHPDTKLHIYGLKKDTKAVWSILKKIQDNNGLGEVKEWVTGLDNVYRAADLTLTPHTIATRTIRESMACGCPVASLPDINLDKIDQALEADREDVRAYAQTHHHPKKMAMSLARVVNESVGVIKAA